MASTIKVNNIQNQCGANIVNKASTTITLGASGDTITLACGASQTGFGRTGTVDWDTTAKTASFTAVSGNGYFVNTTSGAVTMTLPATPSAGDIVSVKDYAYTFATNNFTVNRNGSPIGGETIVNTITYATNGDFLTFIYVDGTKGWLLTNDSTNTDNTGESFIVATGGTITCCGNYRIHTFTSPGTFCVSSISTTPADNTISYLVVAGGGGGAAGNSNGGGAGGGGGFREYKGPADCYTASPLNGNPGGTAITITASPYPISVGAGGAKSNPQGSPASRGSNSIFSTITSTGGGGGHNATLSACQPGGSGGAVAWQPACGGAGGLGNTPPVSPPQGNNAGNSPNSSPSCYAGGGGGGATVAGGNSLPGGGTGGTGATTSINGSPTSFSGGGGGGGSSSGPASPGGAGSPCGTGTAGKARCAGSATDASNNTGGGAGGGGYPAGDGGNGGSGIVIIRYKYQ